MYRWRIVILTAVALLINTSAHGEADPPKKQTDAEITKLLAGKWSTEEGKGDEPKVKSTVVYRKDATFAVQATIVTKEKTEVIELSGTWKVEDGVILDTIEKSNTEKYEKGRVTRDTVISIDEQTLRYTTAKGRERTWKRGKE